MKTLLPALLLAAAASAAPAFAQPTVNPSATVRRPVQSSVAHMPTTVDLLEAVNSLSEQVAQLQSQLASVQGQLASVQGKLDAAQKQASDDYQRTNYRILQTCKVAYLRSFKAGDNPSSGQGGNPFLPDMWCDIGSYPYWKSVQ